MFFVENLKSKLVAPFPLSMVWDSLVEFLQFPVAMKFFKKFKDANGTFI